MTIKNYIPHQHYGQPLPAYTEKPPITPPGTPGLSLSSVEKQSHRSASDKRGLVSWLRRIALDFFVEWWMLEILSWCFSAICMGVIAIILMVYNGEEVPHWRLGLTINGLISVFSNMAKSAMLLSTAEALGQLKWNWFRQASRSMMDFERIDVASRGPWGAFALLFSTKGTTLTSIGALIVILALPLDIFFQQIVSYPLGIMPSPVLAGTISRAQVFNPPDGSFSSNGTLELSSPANLTVISEQFFLGTGTIPPPSGNCSTNECTWEPFDSLAVCSRCSDISQNLQWRCSTAPADWLSNVALSESSYPSVKACGYWFNYGNDSVLMSGFVVRQNETSGEALATRLFPLTDPDPQSRKAIFGGTLQFADIHNPIVDMLISGTLDGAAGVYANKTPILNECVLYWCVNTIQSSFNSGQQLEDIIKSVPLNSSRNSIWPWFAFKDSNGLAHNRYLANFSLTLPHLDQLDPQDNTFTVSNITMVKTILLMDEILPAYVTAPSPDQASDTSLRWLNGGQFFANPPQEVPMDTGTNPWLPPNNVTIHVGRLAAAMSTLIRNSYNENGEIEMVQGVALVQVPLVHVRWAWISFPLVVLAISLVFLVATVVKSSRERDEVGIWKTSVLAVLFNGLGDEVQRSVGPNCSMGEAREAARRLKVKLQPE